MRGIGTQANPFIIENATDLQNIQNDLTAYYELGNDIDCAGITFIPISIFRGKLNGKFYRISNLDFNITATSNKDLGLFNISEGTIQNVIIHGSLNATAINTGIDFGLLCAENRGGNIYQCQSTVTASFTSSGVFGSVDFGGLVENNSGDIINCLSIATVISTAGTAVYCGGISRANGGIISNSFSIVNINIVGRNRAYAAGLVEDNDDGEVSRCFSVGNITVQSTVFAYAGGLIQDNYGATTMNCFTRVATINTNLSATWPRAGGFTHQNDTSTFMGKIINSYSTGVPTGVLVGGFCANNYNSPSDISSCFWDTQTSGTLISDGGTGHASSWMKTQVNFEAAGWDFATIWFIDPSWNDGYPCFQWFRDNVLAGNYDTDTMTELASSGLIPAILPTVTTLPVTGVSL